MEIKEVNNIKVLKTVFPHSKSCEIHILFIFLIVTYPYKESFLNLSPSTSFPDETSKRLFENLEVPDIQLV